MNHLSGGFVIGGFALNTLLLVADRGEGQMETGNEDRLIFVKRVGELASAAHYSAAELACLLGICTRQLQRKFQYYLNCSPQAWLNQTRIRDAEQLLIAGTSVKWTAFQLGFKQVSHFCRHFKFKNGITASKFAQSRTLNGYCRSEITNVARR